MNDKKYVKVNMRDAVWLEDMIWFCTSDFNSLFCMDAKTGKIEHVGTFPNEMYSKKVLYVAIEWAYNKLYCVPGSAKSIAVYDIAKREFSVIELDEDRLALDGKVWRFCGAKKYKNFLFMLPVHSKCIVRLNLENNKVDYLDEWLDKFRKEGFDETQSFFWKSSVLVDNKMYAPFENANGVLELDCDTLQSVVHKIEDFEGGFNNICYAKGEFWMTTQNSKDLVCWLPRSSKIKIISAHSREKEQQNPYLGIAYSENKIMLFPRVLCRESTCVYDYQDIAVMSGQYLLVKEDDGQVIFYELENSILRKMDLRTGEKLEVKVLLDNALINSKQLFAECNMIGEVAGIQCMALMNFLKENYNNKDVQAQEQLRSIGTKIFELSI